ncbi:class I SAM-dependent methyltransferase [Wenyingzhuangia sp. IMCC45533]
MNVEVLVPEVQQFIQNHLNTDITQLILKGSPFNELSTTEIVGQIEAKKKCIQKLPLWFDSPNIYYPNKLNIEQTSSQATALYKANLMSGNSIIDITGGFGVDCWAFAQKFNKVTHCEINPSLSEIVKHNFHHLDILNINYHKGDGIEYIVNGDKIYDWIYVDPSRRNDLKGKVFLLKDCLPNIPEHLDALLEKSKRILIKNSPLIDLTSCIKELNYVKNIYVVALKNEVKEVLIAVENKYVGNIGITAVNVDKQTTSFDFIYQKEYQYNLSEPLTYLYEPNASILKAGGFHALCRQFDVQKLHANSHLYTSQSLIDFPGRKFKIMDVLNYNKKQILKKLPLKKANITTRNFKESVATIRKKTGIKDGGDTYLFFTTNPKNEQIVLLCHKIV